MTQVSIRDPGTLALVMCAYLAVCLVLGALAWKRTASLADYILGGRRLGSVVTAFSTTATDMSGWLLMGFPAMAYLSGFDAVWFGAGSLFFAYLNWRFVAPRLRAETERLGNALTLPDYFEARLQDHSRVLRTATALLILVFFTLYTSSGFVAGGRLLETLFGLDYWLGVLIGGVAIVGYVYLGGFLAVSWSDVLQGTMMLVALIVVAWVGVDLAGGPSSMFASLAARDPQFLSPWIGDAGQPLTLVGMLSLAAFSIGYPGQPHILARFMATRSVGELPVARRVAMAWHVTVFAAAILIGFSATLILPVRLEGAEAEKVFILMSVEQLPAWAAGLCLAGIAAAIMSTAAAQLIVASSAATEDLYRRLVSPDTSPRRLLQLGRAAVLAVTVLGMLLALKPGETVFSLVAWAWAGFGATFGPAVITCLYWRGANRDGVLAGMVVGAATVFLWRSGEGGLFELYELIPAFVFSLVTIFVVSSLRRNRA